MRTKGKTRFIIREQTKQTQERFFLFLTEKCVMYAAVRVNSQWSLSRFVPSKECELLLAHRGALLSALKCQDLEDMVKLLHGYDLIGADLKESFLSLQCDKAWDQRRQLRVRYLLQLVYEKVRRHKYSFDRLLKWLKDLEGEGEKVYDILCKERATCSVGEAGEVQDTERCLTEDDIPELIGVMASVAHLWEDISIALKIPINIQADIRKEGGSSKVELYKALNYWVLGDCLKPVTTSTLKQVLAGPIVGVPSIADKIPTMKRSPVHNQPGDDAYPSVDTPKIFFQSMDTKVTYGRSNLLEVEVSNANSSLSYQWYKDGHELSDDDYYENTKSSILLVCHRNMTSKHIEGKYVCRVDGKISSDEVSVVVCYPDRIKLLLDNYRKLDEVPKDSWPPKRTESFVELALIDRNSNNLGEYDYSVRGDMDDILNRKNKIKYNQVFGRYESGALVLVEGRPGCGKTTLAHKVTRDWSKGEMVLVGAELVFLISLRILNFTQKDTNIFELMEHYYAHDTKNIGESIRSNQGEKTCFIFDGLDEYQRKDRNLNTFIEELLKGKLSNAMVIVFTRPVGSFQLKKSRSRIYNHIEILGFKKDQIHDYIDSYFGTSKMAQGLKEYLDQHINVLHMCYLPVHASMICYLYSQERDNLPTTETQIYTQFTTCTISRKLMREDRHLKEVCLEDLGERNKDQLFEICKLAFEMTSRSEQVFCRSKDSIQLIDEFDSDGPSLGLVTVDIGAKSQGYKDFYSFLHLTFQEYLAAYYINQLENEKQLELLRDYKNNESMLVVWKFYCGLIGINPNSAIQDKIQIITSSKHADSLYRVHCAFESQHSLSCDAVLNNSEQMLSFEKTILRLFDYNAIGYVISKLSGPLGLKFYTCTFDKNGISQLLAKTADSRCEPVKELLVHNKKMTLEQLHCINVLLRNFKSLQVLDLYDTKLDESDIDKLTDGVTLPELKCIKVPFIRLDKNYMKVFHLLRINSCSTFESVHIGPSLKKTNGQVYFNCLQSNFNSCTIIGGNFDIKRTLLNHIKLNKDLHFGFISHCTTLELKNCSIDDSIMTRICEGLKKSFSLEMIVLDYNRISGAGAAELASSLQCLSTLKYLSIACNLIDDSGAKALASVLCRCTSLNHLNLEGNRIGEEGAVAMVEALDMSVELHLGNDKITGEGIRKVLDYNRSTSFKSGDLSFVVDITESEFARVLKCCTNLQTITFSTNTENEYKISRTLMALLEQLPHLTVLKELALNFGYGNSMKHITLAGCLKSSPNLKTLDISGSNIGSEGASKLGEYFKSCINLQRLNLRSSRIGSEGAIELAERFKCWTNLQKVDISRNNIGSKGAVALAKGFKSWTNLQELDISENNIGSKGATALAKGFKNGINLQELDISGNNIGSDGVAMLAEGLKSCIKLRRLNISRNCIGLQGVIKLAEGLKRCTNLQEFDISRIYICSEGLMKLVEVLKTCIKLQTLNICWSNISSEGAVKLAEGLRCWTILQELNISGNNIGSEGASKLGEDLKSCIKLQRLDISSNDIGSEGAVELAEGLKCWINLQELAIGGNNIGLKGVAKLAKGLIYCTKLQKLDISRNCVCSKGAVELAKSFKCCPNLQELDISMNNIASDGAVELAEGLKSCIKLQKLNISKNDIKSAGVAKLTEKLKRCINLQY